MTKVKKSCVPSTVEHDPKSGPDFQKDAGKMENNYHLVQHIC